MNNWTTYLKHFSSFNFEFSFKVNIENYKERILKFDRILLTKGLEYGIIVFDEINNIESIECYLKSRESKFWINQNDNNIIKLIDFKQWEDYNGKGIQSIFLPWIESKEVINKRVNYSENIYQVLSYESSLNLFENNLKEEYWEDKEIFISLSSNSNIWWDEFNITIKNGENWYDKEFFDPPINNRLTSYRITPKFNSFLRELKKITTEFRGEMKLGEYDTKRVKVDGVILDGKIIYQEDIDEGGVKIPEIKDYPA